MLRRGEGNGGYRTLRREHGNAVGCWGRSKETVAVGCSGGTEGRGEGMKDTVVAGR